MFQLERSRHGAAGLWISMALPTNLASLAGHVLAVKQVDPAVVAKIRFLWTRVHGCGHTRVSRAVSILLVLNESSAKCEGDRLRIPQYGDGQ